MAKKGKRLDLMLVERGLAESRAKAQALILSGNVFSGGKRLDKAGTPVAESVDLEVRGKEHPYVGRGGVKLEAALTAFGINPEGKAALDIGASTGGFTDCLLARGAARVTALDVGSNQLDWKLRTDPRVRVIENYNARGLKSEEVGGPFDVITIDVSFISLKLILPSAAGALSPDGVVVALIKPQFEAGRDKVEKGGLVKNPAVQRKTVEDVCAFAQTLGLTPLGQTDSPITGAKGNREFFAAFKGKSGNIP